MPVDVKICGLSDEASVDVAVGAGARHVGFVFFEASPRAVAPARAGELAARVPAGVTRVGLVVDASDSVIDPVVAQVGLDMLQLHGRESPERVAKVRQRFGLPVMKAVAIAGSDDLALAREYEDTADMLLFDAKAPRWATRPGGNAEPFDWSLLGGSTWSVPWFLAGGLTPDNLADAVAATGAERLDVSSGVESVPGVKDHDLIRAFIETAQAL